MFGALSLVQKLAGGAVGLLLLVLSIYAAIQHAEARHWHKVADQRADQIRGLGAAIESQNRAVAQWKAEADAKQKAAAKALAEATKHGDALRHQADKIDRPRPLSGKCETPSDVRGIQL